VETLISKNTKTIKVRKKKNKSLPKPELIPSIQPAIEIENTPTTEVPVAPINTLSPPTPPIDNIITEDVYKSSVANLKIAHEQLSEVEAEAARRSAGEKRQGVYHLVDNEDLNAINNRLKKVILKLGALVDKYEAAHSLYDPYKPSSLNTTADARTDQPLGTPVIGGDKKIIINALMDISDTKPVSAMDEQIGNSHVIGELSSGQEMSSGIFNVGKESYQVVFTHDKSNPLSNRGIRYIYKLDETSEARSLPKPPVADLIQRNAETDEAIASTDEEINKLASEYTQAQTIEDRAAIINRIVNEGKESGFGDEGRLDNLVIALEEQAAINGTEEQLTQELDEILGTERSAESIEAEVMEDYNNENIKDTEPQYAFSLPVNRPSQNIGSRTLSVVDSDTGKLIGLRGIVIKLGRSLNVPVRFKISSKEVPLGRRPAEVFNPKLESVQMNPDKVRRRRMTEVDVMSHAAGHYFDLLAFRDGRAININGLPSFGTQYDTEINALGSALLPNGTSAQIRNEGIAEFFRRYISEDRLALERVVPQFSEFVENTLLEYPAVRDIFDEAARDIAAYNNALDPQAGDDNAIMDSMRIKDKDIKKMFAPSFKDKMSHVLLSFRRSMEDRLQAIHNTLNRAAKLDPSKKEEVGHIRNLVFNEKGVLEEQTLYSMLRNFIDLKGNIIPGVKNLKEIFKMVKDLDGFDRYLQAVNARDIERPKFGPDGRTRIPSVDSGIPKDVYQRVIARDSHLYNDAASELGKFSNAVLKLLVDSGDVSQESYDKMVSARLMYTPMWRVLEMMDKHITSKGGSGSGITNLPNGPKFTKGNQGSLPYRSPLESFMKNMVIYRAIARKTDLAEKLFSFSDDLQGGARIAEEQRPTLKVTKVPDADVTNVLQKHGVDVDQLKAEIAQDQDLKNASDVSFAIDIFSSLYNANPVDQTIVHKRLGKKILYKLDDTDYYNAVTQSDSKLNNFDKSVIGKIVLKSSQIFRAGSILDLKFSLRNVFKDQTTAMVYSDYGYNPIVFGKALIDVILGRKAADEFHRNGAGFADMMSQDMNQLQKTVDMMLNSDKNLYRRYKDQFDSAETTGEYAKLAWDLTGEAVLGGLQKFSHVMEEATRVGLYTKTLKVLTNGRPETATEQQIQIAVKQAKDTTLPYHRSGTFGAKWNRYVPFTNANLQDISKFIRAHSWEHIRIYDKSTGKFTFRKNTLIKAAMLHVPLAILTTYFGHDDDKIEALSPFRKTGFWNFNLKRFGVTDDDLIISFPKTFLLGQIYGSSVETALRWGMKKDPNAVGKWMSGVIDQLVPNVAPPQLVAVGENYINYHFFTKTPLENQSLQQVDPEFRFTPSTSDVARKLAKHTQWTGNLANSPVKTDNLIRGMFGGLGRASVDMLDYGLAALGNDDVPKVDKRWSEHYPINAFFDSPYTPSDYVRRFYDASKLADSTIKTFAHLRSKGKEGEDLEYQKGHRNALMWYQSDASTGRIGNMSKIVKTKAELTKISNSMISIRNDNRINSDRKRDDLLRLSKQRDRLAKKAFEQYFRKKEKEEVF
jgi:hypothetical protein